ncbi:lysophospholipase, putative [Plasmodium ovale]|uniref:Lysophospholipase, putative n=2 Tax=Plasmodium ovale TaxID=36330 RepID=A0A1A8XA34_PLAOA|nr:lysophospholipase, putative [Plasmodium ovale curtisi]SBT01475.1 lysophospholipase, putative [Plasmodium ovale curtisi]SCA48509.1 lysophospholipase, putative [Plasmodium ovale]
MAEKIIYGEEINITPNRLDGKPILDSFFNRDGLLLRTYGWLVRNAIGIILLIHGLGSHARLTFLRHNVEIVSNDKAIMKDGNNYYLYKDSWIEHFNKNGYSVYALDLQGHGLSDGWDNLKANVKAFDDFAFDIIQYINKIQDTLNVSDDTATDSTSTGTHNNSLSAGTRSNSAFADTNSNSACGGTYSNFAHGDTHSNFGHDSTHSNFTRTGTHNHSSHDSRHSHFANEGMHSHFAHDGTISHSSYDSTYSNFASGGTHRHSESGDTYSHSAHGGTINHSSHDDTISHSSRDVKITEKKMLPTYILGISMGGNIALRTLQILGKSRDDINKKLNIRGCVSVSGMISVELLTSPSSYTYKLFFLPLSNFISDFFPNARLIAILPFQRYPFIKDILKFDKIRFKEGITYRFGRELLKAMDNLDNDIDVTPKDIPVLFIHSKDDPFCYCRGAVSFYNRLNVNNKELHILQNMEHVLTVEPGNMDVLKRIMNWLTSLSEEEIRKK